MATEDCRIPLTNLLELSDFAVEQTDARVLTQAFLTKKGVLIMSTNRGTGDMASQEVSFDDLEQDDLVTDTLVDLTYNKALKCL